MESTFIAFALVAAVGVLLTGCGPKPESDTEKANRIAAEFCRDHPELQKYGCQTE